MTNTLALPATGGGYPYVATGARIVNPYDPKALTTVTVTLTMDAEAEENGRRVVELIREACTDRDLDRVAILHILFRNIACRVPEFHPVVHEVVARGDRKEIEKLFDFPRKGRGRRSGDVFYFTALIEYVMETEDLDEATQAVAWLREHRGELVLPENFLPTDKALLNQHAALGEYFRLWSSSIYVKAELLTMLPPELPGAPFTPEMVESARFPPKDGSSWPHGLLVEIRPPYEKKNKKK